MNIYVLHHLWKDYITKIMSLYIQDVDLPKIIFFNGCTKIYECTGFLLKYLPDVCSQNCAKLFRNEKFQLITKKVLKDWKNSYFLSLF